MRRAASLLTVALLAHTSIGAQPARFTAEDMLKVVTASVQDLVGRRAAGRVHRAPHARQRRDRQLSLRRSDVSRRRPPCGSSSSTRETGERTLAARRRRSPTSARRRSRATASGWRFSSRRARRRRAAPAMSLLVWPTGRRPGGAVSRSRAPTSIAPTSTLEWTPDGSRVVVSMRTRRARAERRPTGSTRSRAGPIIVHSSKEPFLEWDDLNRLNRWRNVVEVDVATGARHDARRRSASSTNYRVVPRRVVARLSGRRDREDRLRHDRRHRQPAAALGARRRPSRRRFSRRKTSRV